MTRKTVRGGAEIRKRIRASETAKNKKYVCPRTGKKVKRISNSIWENSQGLIYAGGAYSLTTSSGEIFERMVADNKKKMEKK
jgi:ribosomal protein L37AE/L43A